MPGDAEARLKLAFVGALSKLGDLEALKPGEDVGVRVDLGDVMLGVS